MTNEVIFKLAEVEQKAFEEIKQTVASKTLLAYQDYNKLFEIYINDSNFQLVAVIIQ